MRDTLLIFHDGTNFTATITPVSTTRAGGSAVLDVGKSGEEGLSILLSLPAAITGTVPTIDCKIQFSDSATFASGIEDGPAWPQITTSTPAFYRRALKAQSKRRYWRILMTVGGTALVTSGGLTTAIASGPNRDDTA